MTSAIDPTKPTTGVAYTADVRANFLTAKNEITALQSIALGAAAIAGSSSQNFAANALTVASTLGVTGVLTATGGIAIPAVTAPTLLNSWANYGGAQTTASYWKNAYGEVILDGDIVGGASGLYVFTLPAGYRPPKSTDRSVVITISGTPSVGLCEIETNGNVLLIFAGTPTYLSLGGISFRTT